MTEPSGRLSHVAAGESGFTLAELMVAAALLIVVLLAALAVFDLFGRNDKTNNTLTAAQDTARTALDQMSRELVNAQSSGSSSAVLEATPWDLVFQAPDPLASPSPSNPTNLQVVRYCLDTPTGVLWRQWRSPTASLPSGDCPDTGWSSNRRELADRVANGGQNRVFTYNGQDPSDVNAAVPALGTINSLRVSLILTAGWVAHAATAQLATGVFLRNVGP